MKRDAVLLVPLFLLGSYVLLEMPHGSANRVPHLVFLGGLVALLYHWYRSKQKADERMKAIEMGLDPALVEAPWTVGRACLVIGAGVPFGIFGLTWLATLGSSSVPGGIWIGAAMIGMTVLLCGTYLLVHMPASTFGAPLYHHAATANGKPHVIDPDAFDVAGRRG